MPVLSDVYEGFIAHGAASVHWWPRLPYPSDVLMGATLPAIARWVKATPESVSWMGFFMPETSREVSQGAVGGILLLRVYDMPTGTYKQWR